MNGVSGAGTVVFSVQPGAGKAASGMMQTEWRRFGQQAFPRVAAGVGSSAPLVLAGVSGEALAAPSDGGAPVFASAQTARGALIVTGPMSVSDQITMAFAGPAGAGEGGFGGGGFNLTAACSPVPAAGRAAELNLPVPDYALVFAGRPDFAGAGGAASLELVALQAGWRAVVETLILSAEPKPTAVHNL